MGGPKSLLLDADGVPWVRRAVDVLRTAEVDDVRVVLGAAPRAAELVDDRTTVVEATAWADGIDASLAAGLRSLGGRTQGLSTAAVIHLVDLPDVTPEVVRRVLAAVGTAPDAVGRAVFGGRPGHPVVLGRDHWTVAPEQRRLLLGSRGAVLVECGDLVSGRDVDRAEDLPEGTTWAAG